MDFCIYDDILDAILITDKNLLHFKLSKLGQIIRVDKTGFLRPSHIYVYHKINVLMFIRLIFHKLVIKSIFISNYHGNFYITYWIASTCEQ